MFGFNNCPSATKFKGITKLEVNFQNTQKKLSDEQKEDLEEAFDLYDFDRTGFVPLNETKNLFRCFDLIKT
jgi:Ca2+-binding EF-hand superfamily protein